MSVLEKVKNHPQFAGRSEENQIALAQELSDPQQIKEKFEGLLNIEEFEANIREIDEIETTHSLEVQNQKDQQKHETARACHLPVKLFLSKLQRTPPPLSRHITTLLRMEYGPLHAGLIVGDISIEWDDCSLVVPSPTPFSGAVQTHIDSEGEWLDVTMDAVGQMSLANRQHLDIPKKLEIIYNSRAEKERLINCLADVIVRYNRCKKYSIFRCNCQDFVKDALQSLGIRKLPKFEGNLKGYIEGLQGGKAACITFKDHSELDDYVQVNADTLKIHEKEYLVCMYFQFHMAEMRDLSPKQQDEWNCSVQGCLCEYLESQIIDDSLHFYQFRKQHEEKVVSLHHSEQVGFGPEPQIEIGPELGLHCVLPDSMESVETQVALLAKCSGYSDRVKAKLRNHSMFLDKSEAEITRMSEILSEKEKFREQYFSKFIDTTSIEIISEVRHDQSKLSLFPEGKLQKRSSLRFEKLFNVHMKVLLRASSKPTRRMFSAGNIPLHCALQLGDYVFEWNESHLVVPVDASFLQAEPVLLSPVHQQSEWFSQVHRNRETVRQSIETNDYEMQINLYFEWTQRKDLLVSTFISKIIEYNRYHTYHPRHCNSKRFVEESMRSLGINDPPKLSISIKQHISQLKRSVALSKKNLTSHVDLDAVVADVLTADLSKNDTEFLMAHYLLFHMDSFERSEQSLDVKWTCSVPQCRLQDLEKKLGSFSFNDDGIHNSSC